ncbi:MAG: hypothetical protein WD070_04485, partial [Pirellulaceae bacterium]
MSIVLAFTPAGRITAIESTSVQRALLDVADDRGDHHLKKVARAFALSQAAGLFTLATEKFGTTLAPSLSYWRSFAGRYLTELCHTVDPGLQATPAPESADLDAIVRNAPPMQGAEYLTSDALAEVWSDLDAWVRAEGSAFEGGLAKFLERRAPLW